MFCLKKVVLHADFQRVVEPCSGLHPRRKLQGGLWPILSTRHFDGQKYCLSHHQLPLRSAWYVANL